MGLFDFLKSKKDNENNKTSDEKITENEVIETTDEIEILYNNENEEELENYEKTNEETENKEKTIEETETLNESKECVIDEFLDAEQEVKHDIIEEVDEQKKGFFHRLKEGLGKTRKNILGSVDSVLGAFNKIDEDLFEELEEALITADLGVKTTMDICENLRKRVKKENVKEPSQIKSILCDEIRQILVDENENESDTDKPTVILVIGVNGVGKTTTIGKLTSIYKKEGKKVILAAADTFRAAAIDQLAIWAERCNVDIIKHEENSDPAAVVFDAANAAKKRKSNVLICDTAGRLHNKKNLMEELKKISKVIEKEYPEAKKEVLLVLDATTGQNALQQAKIFKEAADITGIILTKLDGTAKGGIVIAIKSELKIPVKYIGVGEGINDLQKFNPKSFAEALFEE